MSRKYLTFNKCVYESLATAISDFYCFRLFLGDKYFRLEIEQHGGVKFVFEKVISENFNKIIINLKLTRNS